MSRQNLKTDCFYYHAPAYPTVGCYNAPTGWYQYTESGLKYLGPSILERVEYPKSAAAKEGQS